MIQDPTSWLADVSRHCRAITEAAALAWRDVDEYDEKAARDQLRKVLALHKEELAKLLPADFPRSRMGDLGRHIGFCDLSDWKDIVLFDVPDVLAKAEAYSAGLRDVRVGELDAYVHPLFRTHLAVVSNQVQPDYHGLILKACVVFASEFKKKTGAKDDSDAEIGKALGGTNPTLLVTGSLDSEADKNFQRGALLILQGLRAFFRNTYSHEELETDRETAVQAIMLLSLAARILEHSVSAEESAKK